ncbi:MAG: hypothetical protein KDA20_12760 [Phycisphaerales bacterium]|nr:hypothetical protein [Phycisphaerales bacterium]
MIRFSITLLAYGAALVFVGFLTYFVAPPGANAATAAIVSSVGAVLLMLCAICAPLVRERRKLGLIAIYGGMALPIILGMGSLMRLSGSLKKTQEFNAEFEQSGSIALVASGAEKRHNTAYQTVGIGATVVLSAFAFVVLVMHRPKIPAAKPKPVPAPAKSAEPPPLPDHSTSGAGSDDD